MAIENQEGLSLNPGDEEEFIRQLQEQLAGESNNEEDFDNVNPLNIKEEDKKPVENTKKVKKVKEKKKTHKEIKGLSFILTIFEFFLFPILMLVGLFYINLKFENMIVKGAFFTLVSLSLGFFFYILYRHKVKKSSKVAEDILIKISEGKLSFDIEKDYYLKSNLGPLAEPIEKVIKEISDIITKVELSALDIVGNSDALSYFASSMANKTDQQEDSILQIDNSAKILNEAMQSIRHYVETAYENSKNSIKEADNSSAEILSLIEEMHRISDMSEKIISTMNFISDIADETNLLALNAAIQAAHAGEEGKGFGVVATEIRNLAESSSKAAKTIYQTIEETVESISKGVTVSERAKKALSRIVASIKETEDLMSEINEAINKQSETTNSLKESLTNIGVLTKNINNDTQNMKAAISNLAGQAQILTNLIKGFEIHASSIKSDVIFGVEH
ncbi:MAG TPA: methyl-accepting chemotaxis protein [Spirochaetota bacterium]|nr:methyl-accepting chemotaxis protein [Spirochaetota bacterium]HOL57070.1 methyl-accepting chemotaxis protein [Spirochaetota bacterium]